MLLGESLDADTQGVLVVFAIITGVVLGLQILGAWRLYRAPLLWSIVLASVYSLDALLRILGGSDAIVMATAAVVTFLYWCVVALAGRALRLMRE